MSITAIRCCFGANKSVFFFLYYIFCWTGLLVVIESIAWLLALKCQHFNCNLMNEFGVFYFVFFSSLFGLCWSSVFGILMEYRRQKIALFHFTIAIIEPCKWIHLGISSLMIFFFSFSVFRFLFISFAFVSRIVSVIFIAIAKNKKHTHFQRVFTSHVVWEYFFTLQWFIYTM